MKLSPHFHLDEFLRSSYAARHGIDMTPPREVALNLERLANEIMEPIRSAIGAAIHITSGYRPSLVNAAVGGAKNSAHVLGMACDFVAVGVPLATAASYAREACDSLPVGKLIVEFGAWLHVQVEPYGRIPRRQYLVAASIDGRTVYTPWA